MDLIEKKRETLSYNSIRKFNFLEPRNWIYGRRNVLNVSINDIKIVSYELNG